MEDVVETWEVNDSRRHDTAKTKKGVGKVNESRALFGLCVWKMPLCYVVFGVRCTFRGSYEPNLRPE